MSHSKQELLVRSLVRKITPYVPGEQPKIKDLVKLNTNENPYPPSPAVLEKVKAAVDGRFRLYPNPTAEPLRVKLAALHRCKPEQIIVGNGSDELLALAIRAFVDPTTGRDHTVQSWERRTTVQFFTPSYSLYPVLAGIHGSRPGGFPLEADFDFPGTKALKKSRGWDCHAALTFITTPNAPSGKGYTTNQLKEICLLMHGVVVLDEAYVDFSKQNAMSLALKCPNVLVARTFSKAYSLCFQRVGYMVGPEPLISALHKIRDSYNVNGLGQIAAEATLDDLGYYRNNFARIIKTRDALSAELASLGFKVTESQTNFLLVHPPGHTAEEWLGLLRAQKILVRWFSDPTISHYLRITIGNEEETEKLLRAVRLILGGKAPGG